MSYILFGRTSKANGLSGDWAFGALNGLTSVPVSPGGPVPQLGNGNLQVLGTESSFSGESLITSGDTAGSSGTNAWRAFDLSDSGGQTALTTAGANVLGTAGTGDDLAVNTLAGNTLTVGMSDKNWNGIKNVEVLIDTALTGSGTNGDGSQQINTLNLQNFVDVRAKIGNVSPGCVDAATYLQGERFTLNVSDAKRGQLDASQSDMAVDINLSLFTNDSGWQNSFTAKGSVFGDTMTVTSDAHDKTSQFGLGAGQNLKLGNQAAYNGDFTAIFAQMGAGDDAYTAVKGVTIKDGAFVEGDLRSLDRVWGGSGDDVIKTGAGDDVLFGDFGGVFFNTTTGKVAPGGGAGTTFIGVTEDPEALHLKIGGSDNPADWNVGGASVYAILAGGGAGELDFEADVNGILTPAAASAAAGLGVDQPGDGNTVSNGGSPNNAEIGVGNNDTGDSDILGVKLGNLATEAKVTLSLFYANDGNVDGRVETAIIRLGKDLDGNGRLDAGESLGWARVAADGTILSTSGVAITSAAFVAGPGSDAGGNPYNRDNPGLFNLTAEVEGGGVFDLIEFESGGLVNNSGTDINNNDVSDFYVRSICTTVADACGNDILDAGAGADYLMGGCDTGVLKLALSVTIDQSNASFKNSVGYVNYATGKGVVLDDNALDPTPPVTLTDFAVSASDLVNGGWFIVPNGAGKTPPVTTGPVDIVQGAGTDPTTVQGYTAFFDRDAYNPGDLRQATSSAPIAEGTGIPSPAAAGMIGAVNFEDRLRDGNSQSDSDFNDVMLTVKLEISDDATAGDTLYLGENDKAKDIVAFRDGDGFDLVYQFEKGTDELHLEPGDTVTQYAATWGSLSGLLVLHGDDGDALFLVGVNAPLTSGGSVPGFTIWA